MTTLTRPQRSAIILTLLVVVLSTVFVVGFAFTHDKDSKPAPTALRSSEPVAEAPSAVPEASGPSRRDEGELACLEMSAFGEVNSIGVLVLDFVAPEQVTIWSGMFASSEHGDLAEAGIDWTKAFLDNPGDRVAHKGQQYLLDGVCGQYGVHFLPAILRVSE